MGVKTPVLKSRVPWDRFCIYRTERKLVQFSWRKRKWLLFMPSPLSDYAVQMGERDNRKDAFTWLVS